jgi:hypothetical protein
MTKMRSPPACRQAGLRLPRCRFSKAGGDDEFKRDNKKTRLRNLVFCFYKN